MKVNSKMHTHLRADNQGWPKGRKALVVVLILGVMVAISSMWYGDDAHNRIGASGAAAEELESERILTHGEGSVPRVNCVGLDVPTGQSVDTVLDVEAGLLELYWMAGDAEGVSVTVAYRDPDCLNNESVRHWIEHVLVAYSGFLRSECDNLRDLLQSVGQASEVEVAPGRIASVPAMERHYSAWCGSDLGGVLGDIEAAQTP
jgi:hypothetical protein